MKSRVSSKGQIVVPAELRKRDRIEAGQEVDFERLGRGEYKLVVREPAPNTGVVAWLTSCPSKGFFVPVDSGSTDDL